MPNIQTNANFQSSVNLSKCVHFTRQLQMYTCIFVLLLGALFNMYICYSCMVTLHAHNDIQMNLTTFLGSRTSTLCVRLTRIETDDHQACLAIQLNARIHLHSCWDFAVVVLFGWYHMTQMRQTCLLLVQTYSVFVCSVYCSCLKRSVLHSCLDHVWYIYMATAVRPTLIT